jgi:hypothetical protein
MRLSASYAHRPIFKFYLTTASMASRASSMLGAGMGEHYPRMILLV